MVTLVVFTSVKLLCMNGGFAESKRVQFFDRKVTVSVLKHLNIEPSEFYL